MKLNNTLRLVICVATISAWVVSAFSAETTFYRGKTLTVLINFATGGPTDIEGRLVARFLGKHLPGQPLIVVQNMPGAGGMTGTNYLGEIARVLRVPPSPLRATLTCCAAISETIQVGMAEESPKGSSKWRTSWCTRSTELGRTTTS